MSLSAVIFDMDGVIIDSEPLHVKVVINMLGDLGVEVGAPDMIKYTGTSNANMWDAIIATYGLKKSKDELREDQHRRNMQTLAQCNNILLAGIKELMTEIQKEGLPMAIASSSNMEYIQGVVEKYGLSAYMRAIVSGEQVKQSKPHPEIFLKTAHQLGVDPEACVVIEDSQHGVQAGVDAGMKVIGLINPNSGKQNLSKASCCVDSLVSINPAMMRGLFGR
ncbi:MAG: HAD family phosphatase [Cyclobacteriaceae bacterium]|nr:HAD family phosphatase [Cyclobacteriaceae bacterium]